VSTQEAPEFSQSALDLLRGAEERRVLVIGDVMFDRFIYGAVDRISPEAPIPVFNFEREAKMLGGAGNVVRNLLALGAQATFLSVIGDDVIGKQLLSLVGEESHLVPYLITEKGRTSSEKTRYVASGQQLLRADNESRAAITEASAAQLSSLIEAEIPGHHAVILSDYAKGVLTPALIRTAIDTAKKHNVPVFVDPKRRDMRAYAGATVISPNAKEFLFATAQDQWDDAAIAEQARALLKDVEAKALLITRGAQGMALVDNSGARTDIAAAAQEVFDVSGAGDTAIAALALSVACGMSLADAARTANLAAGIVVGRLGTAVVHQSDLSTALYAEHSVAMQHKILPLPLLRDKVANWRREGLTIGFTNGCFDILHAGHVTLLNDAAQHCDRLVVAINSDASVKRLKGPTRPVNNEMDRALLIAALSTVDAVAIFEEDTPLPLIEALKPDVLMKGADYTMETVIGAPLVKTYGGRVVLLPLKTGYSTTGTIAKLMA
jgi:D-beta-D-heptose 7-phosphate kinase/D-beta-D-heptose 1-phosphate adenosyltransferase